MYSVQPDKLDTKLHTSSTVHLLMSSSAGLSSPSRNRPPMVPGLFGVRGGRKEGRRKKHKSLKSHMDNN